MAVPQYLRSVESSRQVEAIEILAEIRRAEYRYNAKAGHFTGELADLSFEDAELLDDPFFAFDIPSATKSTFILRALRNDSKRLKETPAYAITMDHKGNLNRGI
ncbi:MAG: hypothetical protein JW937_08265 [Candidatus Omnitrophica bacterium]|nr:hypothetical protein [Candidatus Omnitrophota bacterium]